MKKRNYSLIFTSVIVCMMVGSLIFYISLLGENNKIEVTSARFFNSIKNNDYEDALKTFTQQQKLNRENHFDETILENFLVELSILQKFELLSQEDYKIEAQRNSFWFPFVSSDSVDVNIRFLPKGNGNFLKNLFSTEKKPYLEKLLTVTREKGSWKITGINIANSSIKTDYTELKDNLRFNKYIEVHENGFSLNRSKIDFSETTLTELKLIQFSLRKALEKTNITLNTQPKTAQASIQKQ